ncbi:MAG: AarF/ABC1/UbiB kinase family protein [Deltaproteobacteria bacterium]|nr:AarF/ABC1/UbiB kinase family protein [Deltaproteobacteria bacterium]
MLTVFRLHRNIRFLKRYRNILTVLIKYGFGHIVDQLNLTGYLELGRKLFSRGAPRREITSLTPPERLRLAMEELGTTFIKLGQLLSTRPDLIPQPFADEFRKLQDHVPAVPFAKIRAQLEDEIGARISAAFKEFDENPIAAASIAQVHRGRLKSGEEVAVKVRRPNILQTVETDLEILLGIAQLIRHHFPDWEIYDPIGIVKNFRRTIRREMDFTKEAFTIDRFAANFAEDETVYVPKVFWEHTGETVLTMEFIHGIKVSLLTELRAKGYDLKAIARNGANAILKQVLLHGFFHGDPHPGNVFVLEGNTVCLLDYGMVGRLDENLKQHLADLLNAVVKRDVERLVAVLRDSGELQDETNLRELHKDLREFVDDYYGLPLKELNTGKLLYDFAAILNRYRINFPSDLMLLAKALVTVEGIGRQLDPDFNMVGMLSPLITQLIRDRMSAASLSKEIAGLAQSYGGMIKRLPWDIKELINRLNQDKFRIDLRHQGFERLIVDLDKASNRISFSLLTAALVVGSSLIMQTDKGPLLFGFPILGLIGYSIAALLGLWLALAILRSGRL